GSATGLEGGERGGLVRPRATGKAVATYGLARVPVQQAPGHQARAVEVAVRTGIERAMDDLKDQLSAERHLHLSVRVSGLDSETRKGAAENFLPCLKQHFDALGAVTEPREVAGFLEDDVTYAPAKDEPREALQWQRER